MTTPENLIGNKYGKLTVLSRAPDTFDSNNRRIINWNCICECGNITIKSSRNLKYYGVKSCGCLKVNRAIQMAKDREIDLSGNKYGKLTVVEKDTNKKSGYWLCKCDCENPDFISIRRDHLIKGEISTACKLCKEKKQNIYDLDSFEYGIGYTSNTHKEFLFDKEDYDKIKNYCWYEDIQKGYIVANTECGTIGIHRVIMDNPIGKDVDHIRHNLLDNRKKSLRVCEHQQNQMNCKLSKNNTSGYTGVSYSKDRNKWRAEIGYKNSKTLIGYYDNKDDAVEARRLYEENLFKEWSYKNSMIEVDDEEQ